MTLKSIISIAIISLVVVFALWYLVTHIWYLLVPNIEAFTVNSLTVDGKKINRVCRIVRIGNDYLIPLVAAGVLFDFKVKTQDEGERIFISDGKNFTIQMRLYDPLVTINQKEKLLRTPPIDSRSPMIPVEVFRKLLKKDIKFTPPLKQHRWSEVQSFVVSALQKKITLLNLITGILFTGLWISTKYIMRYTTRDKDLESSFWRITPYMLLGLLMLFYVIQVITARIESLYF